MTLGSLGTLVVLGGLVLAVASLAAATAVLGSANRELRANAGRWEAAVGVLQATCARLRAVRVRGEIQPPDGCWCLASGETIGQVIASVDGPRGGVPRQSRGEVHDPWRVPGSM